jgi:hypothetical protein
MKMYVSEMKWNCGRPLADSLFLVLILLFILLSLTFLLVRLLVV